jgi:response regulator RpfG family c-di-GMP phosphodiesterase
MTTAASHSGDGVSIAHGLVLTVLVVDDEIDTRGIVKRVLEMNGATVSAAGSASRHKSAVSPDDSREAAPPH